MKSRSSTKIDRGSVNRGGPEKSVTTSRIHGMGSNEATYGAMKSNLKRHADGNHNDKPPAPRGKSERGPGGFE